jgi:hypothetical protein
MESPECSCFAVVYHGPRWFVDTQYFSTRAEADAFVAEKLAWLSALIRNPDEELGKDFQVSDVTQAINLLEDNWVTRLEDPTQKQSTIVH